MRSIRRALPSLLLLVAASAVAAAPEPAVRHDGAGTVAVEHALPGDRLLVSSGQAVRGLDPSDGWRLTDAADGDRVAERRVETDGPVMLRLEGASEQVVVVAVERALEDGRTTQITRAFRLGADGRLEAGPAARVVISRGVRLTPGVDGPSPRPGLEVDAEGRLRLDADDPRLPELAAAAAVVEPYVTAEVQTLADSVSGSNDKDEAFTNYLCGAAVYLGTSIVVSSAPAGAQITTMDVSWTVWHSVDISRFRSAMFRRQSGVWGSPVTLYVGSESGSNTYNETLTGLTNYAGREVNTDYILGCCNRYDAENAYLDVWTITLYYEGSVGDTVDLIADSVGLTSSTVAAGSQAGVFYQGHVGGSGTVPSPFGVGFYLSSDATVTTGDRRLGGVTESFATDPGDLFGNGVVEHVVTVPADVAPGSYTLGMVVDEGAAVSESNESNNVSTTPLTVAAASARPNLQAQSCSVSPSHGAPGAAVDFTWSGRNSGTTASAWFVWGIYLSEDAVIQPGSDTGLLGLDVPGGWPAGYSTGSVTEQLTLPGSLAPGSQVRLAIVLDAGGDVTETTETDNVCSAVFTVDGGTPGTARWLIPAAASSEGLLGTDWRSRIAAANPTASARTATVHYVARGEAWPGSVLSGPHTIPAGQSLVLSDPLLPRRPTTGLVWLEADGPGLAVTSRTYNLGPGGVTYGQGIPAIPLATATASSELILPMVHSVPNRFRTNLGLIQAASGTFQVEVTVYSSGGSLLAVKSYTRTGAWDQITDVFADMGIGGAAVEGAWMKVRLTSGSPAFWTCYASVVDFDTGDPTYVVPVAN